MTQRKPNILVWPVHITIYRMSIHWFTRPPLHRQTREGTVKQSLNFNKKSILYDPTEAEYFGLASTYNYIQNVHSLVYQASTPQTN